MRICLSFVLLKRFIDCVAYIFLVTLGFRDP